jgi:hypothetical protein
MGDSIVASGICSSIEGNVCEVNGRSLSVAVDEGSEMGRTEGEGEPSRIRQEARTERRMNKRMTLALCSR